MGAKDLGRYNLPSPVGLASTCEACVALSWARQNMNRIVVEKQMAGTVSKRLG